MRLAGIEKIGFYPTPEQTTSLTANALAVKPGSTVRLFDPCAGEAEAAGFVHKKLQKDGATVVSYGIEISDMRYLTACQRLTRVISADCNQVAVSARMAGCLWLNPPYDYEIGDSSESQVKKRRQELIFLQDYAPKLQNGGVLVYIVPISALQIKGVQRLLASYMKELTIWSMPEKEFEQFKQVICIGYKRASAVTNKETEEWIGSFTLDHMPPSIETCGKVYNIPSIEIEEKDIIFRMFAVEDDEICRLVEKHGTHTTTAWSRLFARETTSSTPVVPLRKGHIAGLIASGQVGVMNFSEDGILAKGRAEKVPVARDKDGKIVKADDPNVHTVTETIVARVYTIDQEGVLKTIKDPLELQAFLEKYKTPIVQHMNQMHKPLYEEPTAAEWETVSKIRPQKALPGQKVPKLLDAQKHLILAGCRSLKKQGYYDLIAAPGSGKTRCGMSIPEVMRECHKIQSYPAIVLVPSHLSKKWQREIEEMIKGSRAVIASSITDLESIRGSYVPGQKLFVILSKEKAKLGPGWEPTYITKLVEVTEENPRTGICITKKRPVAVCPHCGQIVVDRMGLPAGKIVNNKETGKPELVLPENKRLKCGDLRSKDIIERDAKAKRVYCGQPLYTYGAVGQKNGKFASENTVKAAHRWPLAQYIRRKMRGFFKTFIADESHLFNAKDSLQGYAYYDLVVATKYTVNLTGTMFGGKSTDLFPMRFRIDPDVRRDYKHHEEMAWAEKYGRLQTKYSTNEEDVASKKSTKNKRALSVSEVPGISPTLFARILKSAAFVRLEDLGFKLPDFVDEVVTLNMTEDQEKQYKWMYNELEEFIKGAMSSFDSILMKQARSLLSVWLQNSLCRPNSGFRTDEVIWKNPITEEYEPWFAQPQGGGEPEPMILHPVFKPGELSPKDKWLIETIHREVGERRKVLLYVRQTGTRNIQPHIENLLKQSGLRVKIMPESLKPVDREEWLNGCADEIDVLIVNPRKVATGLDMIMFQTYIYYEIEYSLLVLMQAMRRLFRPQQEAQVRGYYLIYAGSMEQKAMGLIAKKMNAAAMLYGDDASSAISEENEDADASDFMTELANAVLKGEELTTDGVSSLLKHTITVSEEVDSSFTDDALAEAESIIEQANQGVPADKIVNDTKIPDETFAPSLFDMLKQAERETTQRVEIAATTLFDLAAEPVTETVTTIAPKPEEAKSWKQAFATSTSLDAAPKPGKKKDLSPKGGQRSFLDLF